MGGDEWNGAVALLKAWLAHQPAPMAIAVVLAGAFALVMFLEGLRVNFLPARKRDRNKIVSPPSRKMPDIKTSNFAGPSAPQAATTGSSFRAIKRIVPKQQRALRRVNGAPRPSVCHRIKLEMVNLEPVEQLLPLAEQG